LTLSVPDGLIRALRENRLPSKVEVWHAEREEWVSLAAHPAARQALESIGSYMPSSEAIETIEPEAEVIEPEAEVIEPEAVLEVDAAPPEPPAEVPPPEPPVADPLDGLLAAAHEFIPPADPLPTPPPPETAEAEPEELDPVVLLNLSPPPEAPLPPPPAARPSRLDITPPPPLRERRTLETKTAAERRQVAATPPAEPTSTPTGSFKLPSRRVLVGGIALLIAAGYFVKSRSGGAKPDAAPHTVGATANHTPGTASPAPESVPAEVLPVFPADSEDTAPHVGVLALQGVPGAGPEADLETRFRLADALMWDPAGDFGTPADVLRARRKVDAVLNSVEAYRVDMRRLAESGGGAKLGYRMEPFDEASRIDDVIHAMGDAISVLEDVTGRFAVRGGTLEFDRAEDARRYNALRDRADSLLRAPVEMDPHPIIRPPRRLVTRLLTTLPGGMARGASGP